MLWSWSNVGWMALFGAVAGASLALVGGAEAATATIACMAAGVLAGFVAVCGAALAVLVNAGAWLVGRLGIDRKLAPFTSRDPAAPRRPVVRAHAFVLASVVMLAGLMLVYERVLGRAWLADEPEFGQEFALLVLAVLTAAVAVATIPLGLLLAPLLRRFDARIALPFPAHPTLRYLIWFAVPTIFVMVGFLEKHRDELESLAATLELAIVLVAASAVWTRPGRRVRASRSQALRASIVPIAMLGNFVAAAALLESSEHRGLVVAELPAVGPALERLRRWTDVDGDHVSSVLGENDCAPFDPAIRTGFTDVPGNGIDEDCDGKDARMEAGQRRQLYSDALTPKQTRKYNVIWIVIDAVRADHTTMHGYEHDTTPYLAHLAEESLLFQNALSQSSATLFSFPSMMLGLNPDSIEWKPTEKIAPADGHVTMGERMKAEGYSTSAIVADYMSLLTDTFRGFDEIEVIGRNTRLGRWRTGRAGAISIEAMRMIDEAVERDKPFFLTLYYGDPHADYRDHEPGIAFADSKTAKYDEEIAFVDRHIGFLIEYLHLTGHLWRDTIVIVTADHGEEFRDHGARFHGKSCHREVVNVPLVVHIPGIEPGIITTPVALVDIVPTLLEAIGAPLPSEPLDGQSLLVPVLRPELVDAERPIFCSIISLKERMGNFYRRSVRVGDRALMQAFDTGAVQLFDTSTDPEETQDLAADPSHADTVASMRALLDRALTGNMSTQRIVD